MLPDVTTTIWFGGAFWLRLVGIFATAILAGGCGRDVEVLLDCPSPDRRERATFYWVHGGGAAGWAFYRVTVRGVDEDLRPDRYQFQMRHGQDVRMRWKSSSDLVVEYPDEAMVDRREHFVNYANRTVSTTRLTYLPVETGPNNSVSGGTTCSGS
jgi:hypothetical protein